MKITELREFYSIAGKRQIFDLLQEKIVRSQITNFALKGLIMEISVSELSRDFSNYLERVSKRGDTFVIIEGKRPFAQISPIPKGKVLGELAQILSSSTFLTSEEADEFAKDLCEIRNEGQ